MNVEHIDLLRPVEENSDPDAWHEGPPPAIGWWNATNADPPYRRYNSCSEFWRFWNGRFWTTSLCHTGGSAPRRDTLRFYETSSDPDGGSHPIVWRYRQPNWGTR
jgi:hypothetical protein